jgi:CBS-domain-containing membrane protein
MPSNRLSKAIQQEIEPLSADDLVGTAVRRVIAADLPALPAVEDDGSFAGIFGEREFLAALFPGYVRELASARMVSRDLDATIERRTDCRNESIRGYLTTDHVLIEDDYSDTEVAELFVNHPVLVVPVATDGRIHAVVTRSGFFRALAERIL